MIKIKYRSKHLIKLTQRPANVDYRKCFLTNKNSRNRCLPIAQGAHARQTRDHKNKRGANSAFVLCESRLSSEPPAESGWKRGVGGFERTPQTRPGTGDIRDPCAVSAPGDGSARGVSLRPTETLVPHQ